MEKVPADCVYNIPICIFLKHAKNSNKVAKEIGDKINKFLEQAIDEVSFEHNCSISVGFSVYRRLE